MNLFPSTLKRGSTLAKRELRTLSLRRKENEAGNTDENMNNLVWKMLSQRLPPTKKQKAANELRRQNYRNIPTQKHVPVYTHLRGERIASIRQCVSRHITEYQELDQFDSRFWSNVFLLMRLRPLDPVLVNHSGILFELAKNAPAKSNYARALRVRKTGRIIRLTKKFHLDVINETEYLDSYIATGLVHQAPSIWRAHTANSDLSDKCYRLQVGALFHLDAGLWRSAELLANEILHEFGEERITARLLCHLLHASTGRLRLKLGSMPKDVSHASLHWLNILLKKLKTDGVSERDPHADPRLPVPASPQEVALLLQGFLQRNDWQSASQLLQAVDPTPFTPMLIQGLLATKTNFGPIEHISTLFENLGSVEPLVDILAAYLAGKRDQALDRLLTRLAGPPEGLFGHRIVTRLARQAAAQADDEFLKLLNIRAPSEPSQAAALIELAHTHGPSKATSYFNSISSPGACVHRAVLQLPDVLQLLQNSGLDLLKLGTDSSNLSLLWKLLVQQARAVNSLHPLAALAVTSAYHRNVPWENNLQLQVILYFVQEGDFAAVLAIIAHLASKNNFTPRTLCSVIRMVTIRLKGKIPEPTLVKLLMPEPELGSAPNPPAQLDSVKQQRLLFKLLKLEQNRDRADLLYRVMNDAALVT